MVAITAANHFTYYVAAGLRNGQYISFMEAETSIHEAMVSVKAELFQESWDAILIVEGPTGRELFEGSTLLRPMCLAELRKEYPSIAKALTLPWKDTPIIAGAKVWSPPAVVAFQNSSLAR